MFSSIDFLEAINDGLLSVSPFDKELLQPASLDLRLSDEFITFNKVDGRSRKDTQDFAQIDPAKQFFDYEAFLPKGPFFLEPGEFMLASTVETVELSGAIAARVEGKSSLGRLGLLVHATAGFVDPGFRGQLTLELKNLTDYHFKLYPRMKIAQLTVEWIETPAEKTGQLYGGLGLENRYQGQTGPTPSRVHENFKVWEKTSEPA